MKSINLFHLTRTGRPEELSLLLQALSCCPERRTVSPHEASSLTALVRHLEEWFGEHPEYLNHISFYDGFWFSYTIAHISK